jgi:hypothetical protein
MNQEREIHLAVAASTLPPLAGVLPAPTPTGAAGNEESLDFPQPPSGNDEDLGENVEMF